MRKHIALIVMALGSATLFSGCQSVTPGEATSVNAAAVEANTVGAIIAGIVNPALAIPAGTVAGALNAANCATTRSLGGTC